MKSRATGVDRLHQQCLDERWSAVLVHYAAAKAWIGRDGTRPGGRTGPRRHPVNAIVPGWTKAAMTEDLLDSLRPRPRSCRVPFAPMGYLAGFRGPGGMGWRAGIGVRDQPDRGARRRLHRLLTTAGVHLARDYRTLCRQWFASRTASPVLTVPTGGTLALIRRESTPPSAKLWCSRNTSVRCDHAGCRRLSRPRVRHGPFPAPGIWFRQLMSGDFVQKQSSEGFGAMKQNTAGSGHGKSGSKVGGTAVPPPAPIRFVQSCSAGPAVGGDAGLRPLRGPRRRTGGGPGCRRGRGFDAAAYADREGSDGSTGSSRIVPRPVRRRVLREPFLVR